MPSLFDPAELTAMTNRLQGLRPDARAQWGKMDVGQMLAHCQVAFRMALGEVVLKRKLIGYLFGGLARRSLTKPEPFGRNLPTAPEFKIKGTRTFEPERAQLLELVRRFSTRGAAGVPKEPHPFFGKMTAAEWDALQWKHLDHHLRQFGA